MGVRLRACAKAASLLPRLVGSALKAVQTREPADWSRVADHWRETFAGMAATPLQLWPLARLLRSARRMEEAMAVGRQLVELLPGNGAALLELGRAQRAAGHRAAAITTLQAAARAGAAGATADLTRYGARAALPVQEGGIYAPQDYAAFAAQNAAPPPPPGAAGVRFGITIVGNEALVPTTLASLRLQSYPAWDLCGAGANANIELPAGARLDRYALAWLAWTIAKTGCSEVRADHDFADASGTRCDPVLLPAPDFLWTEGPHGIVRFRAHVPASSGPIVHVPLVLMTLPACERSVRAIQTVPDAPPERMTVIIPSRDNPELLTVAIESLLAKASNPDGVAIIVVDNDGRLPETHSALTRLTERSCTSILPFHEAFNWSRANNLAAAVASGEILVFQNDDTAMLTPGWDCILAGLFADPRIGLVGTRLLYPDGSVQHGGFVMGMDNGPQHEGRWHPGNDGGPTGRWTAIRQTAAVTGAFIAIRQADFAMLGGFDENTFAIDFADLDLCLRMRKSGKAVVYCGAISLTHHESHSRGLNLGRTKRRRMAREHAAFVRRWGDAAVQDPWYHPAWTRTGCSFDGLKALSADEVALRVAGPHGYIPS